MLPAETMLRAAGHHRKLWGRIIINAERRGSFDYDDHDAANNWQTCMVGYLRGIEYRPGITGLVVKIPADGWLYRWGNQLHSITLSNSFVGAAELMIKIHKRADKLKEAA